MKKFEYKVVSFQGKGVHQAVDIEEIETSLTGEGLIGWEVTETFDSVVKHKVALCFLLKREIVEELD